MKRIAIALLAGLLAISMSACGEQAVTEPEEIAKETVEDASEQTVAEETSETLAQEEPIPTVSEPEEEPTSEPVNVDLKALLAEATDEAVAYFVEDDFEDNGAKEAFAVTTPDTSEAEGLLSGDLDSLVSYTVWFISSKGAEALDASNFNDVFVYLSSGAFTSGKKAVLIDTWLSARNTRTYVAVVENGECKLLNRGEDFITSAFFTEDGILKSSNFRYDNTFEIKEYSYDNGALVLEKEYTETP